MDIVVTEQARSETSQETKPVIVVKDGSATVHLPDVHIDPQHETKIFMISRRHALPIHEGDTIGPGNRPMKVDNEGKLSTIREEARSLQNLSERERISKLVELVRSNLTYIRSEDQLTAIPAERRAIAKKAWIDLNPSELEPQSLSQIVADGLGVCSEYGTLFALLTNDAGMKAMLHSGDVTNQKIHGTEELIFKNQPEGGGEKHFWAEVETSDNDFIPVDPTAGFIGDTPEKLATFQEAYKPGQFSVVSIPTVEGLPQGVTYERTKSDFLFGESTHASNISFRLAKKLNGETRIPSYRGSLDLRFSPRTNPIQKSILSVEQIAVL